MGEIADDITDGTFCYQCGEYLGEGDGYPRICPACEWGNHKKRNKKLRRQKPRRDHTE
jgi:hypothetical protein